MVFSVGQIGLLISSYNLRNIFYIINNLFDLFQMII